MTRREEAKEKRQKKSEEANLGTKNPSIYRSDALQRIQENTSVHPTPMMPITVNAKSIRFVSHIKSQNFFS